MHPMPAAGVSVIVPVRNRRDPLTELLDPLARQTFRDFECIVAEGGSTDGAVGSALVRLFSERSRSNE